MSDEKSSFEWSKENIAKRHLYAQLREQSSEKCQLADLVLENIELIDLSAVHRFDRINIEKLVHDIRHEQALAWARYEAESENEPRGDVSA